MKRFKRYAPLAGVAYIAAVTIGQAWGVDMSQVQTIGGLLQLDAASPVSAAELTAAAAALTGVVLKILSVVNRAK